MKVFYLFLVTFVPVAALAGECVDSKGNDILSQPEVFQELIEKANSCYEASDLAKACAWGSSLDVSTAGLAYEVCSRELEKNKPTKKLLKLLGTMNDTCKQTYQDKDGTLYLSMHAYCRLNAIDWINNLAGEI